MKVIENNGRLEVILTLATKKVPWKAKGTRNFRQQIPIYTRIMKCQMKYNYRAESKNIGIPDDHVYKNPKQQQQQQQQHKST